MIRFEKVTKVYEEFKAVNDINFEVKKGELVAIIGPSGCGKTTTLRMINRLIEPTEGKIYVDDQDVANVNPIELRRNIGYVIQHIGLLPHMTIGKNVGIVPKLKGIAEKEFSKRIDELLDMVGMNPKEYRDRFPHELSGGQQQRIGVIRALAADPPVILMDEPFSALDPISREQLQDELTRLQKEIKKTIAFVTHDMDEALKISDRILFMDAGEIVQFDTPENILRNPANAFVRNFIGEKRLKSVEQVSVNMLVEKIMTNPPKLMIDYSVDRAIKLINDKKEEAFLIYDSETTFAGIVTADVIQSCSNKNTVHLKDIIRSQVPMIDHNMSLEVAASILIEHGIDGAPVMKQGQIVGVVSKSDILNKLISHAR